MSARQESSIRLIVDGKPVIYRVLSSPVIDDVVISEAKIQAFQIEHGSLGERRVDRSLRDFLIRLGVER